MTQTIVNLGTGGAALNGRNGSTTGADSNDALFLDWDGLDYVYLSGVTGNYLSVPDAAALDITGDIDIRVQVAMDDWTPGANMTLASKWNLGTQNTFLFRVVTTGTLALLFSIDGTAVITATSTANTGITDGLTKWARATRATSSGQVKFWLSDDGVTWTQLGTTVTTSTGNLFSSTSNVEVGTFNGGGGGAISAKIYRAQVFNGIDGTKVLDVDTSVLTTGAATTFTALTGQTVTINRTTAGRKAVAVVSPVWLFGTDDYMEVADNDLIDFGAAESFTVLLVERDWNLAGAAAHVAKVSSLTATTQGWTMRSSGANGALITTQMGDGTNGINSVTTPARVAGALSSLVMVRNVTVDTVTGYTNGTAGTSGTDTTTGSLANSEALRIGRLSGAGVNYSEIELIAAAVFRRALSSSEIQVISDYFGRRLS